MVILKRATLSSGQSGINCARPITALVDLPVTYNDEASRSRFGIRSMNPVNLGPALQLVGRIEFGESGGFLRYPLIHEDLFGGLEFGISDFGGIELFVEPPLRGNVNTKWYFFFKDHGS